MTVPSDLPAVSLFSNCGAGDLGYARAGFHFDVLAELDERRLQVAGLNLPQARLIAGDLRRTWREVVATYQSIRGNERPALLAACPPCQGMSSARGGRGREDDADAGSRDERNLLVEVIARTALALRPRMVVVENVPAFFRRRVRHPRSGAPISAAILLIRSLRQHYVLHAMEADLADFGVPQTRKRAFLCFIDRRDEAAVALTLKGRSPFPRPTHSPDYGGRNVTLAEALAALDLESLDAKSSATAGTGMHSVPVYDDQKYAMVSAIPTGRGASAWENLSCPSCSARAGSDDARCPSCSRTLLRPVVTEHNGSVRLVRGFRTSSYMRMDPRRPAATITTASGHVGSDRTIHPYENRVLSAWECQLLQTIPVSFRWGDALRRWGHTNVRAMIGEAVPPQYTEQHGEVLVGLLSGHPRRAALASSDQRIRKAHARLASAEAAARRAVE